MKAFVFAVILVLNFSIGSEAQRIRYKNLFPVLQSKDYTSAEPQLLKFLEDNDDEANAYFYLGEIITSKLDTIEIFPKSDKYDSLADKAISAYKKSITLVDDREVRKNDDYYAAYNRRDLRTGKFGIKKSDIHLDYETKIKSLTEKKELIAELHVLKSKSAQDFEQLTLEAKGLYEAFPDEESFLLRADSEDKKELLTIIDHYNSFIISFKEFSDKLKSLKNPLYDPQLNIVEIDNWSGLQPTEPNFNNFSISIPNYEQYLNTLHIQIEEEIKPFKDLLNKTNTAFNVAMKKNKEVKDSSNIQKMVIPDELKNKLSQFDKSNTILNLLNYKKQKSKTSLLTNVNLYPVLADSSNIYQRANLVQNYKEQLSIQLELIEEIDESINDRIIKDYDHFINEFKPSVEAFLKTEKAILEQKLDSLTKRNEKMIQQIQVLTNESDSIYLTPLIAATRQSKNYVINSIELDSMLLVGGTLKKDPFIASAGFDMKIRSLELIEDSTFSINNMLMLNENILVNLKSKDSDQNNQILKYLSPKLEEIWYLEYDSESTLGDAKVEAGIFFIYDQQGKVLKTLNSQGEIIGN